MITILDGRGSNSSLAGKAQRAGEAGVSKERKLVDIHVHLDQYPPEEMEQVLKRAEKAGVRWIVTSGMDLQSSESAVEMATIYEQVLASVGIHPWVTAEDFPDNFRKKIHSLARRDITVAIGEVGLDFIDNVFTGVTYHDNQDLRQAQEHAFREQIALACEVFLPLIVHCRGAYSALPSLLREEKAYRVGGVIHNFEADNQTAIQLLDIGFLLSFGGAVTYPTATELRGTIKHIPIDGMLLETDSPYMPLSDFDHQRIILKAHIHLLRATRVKTAPSRNVNWAWDLTPGGGLLWLKSLLLLGDNGNRGEQHLGIWMSGVLEKLYRGRNLTELS